MSRDWTNEGDGVRRGGSPARQDALRQHNLALVLRHIAAAEPVSRARIAAATSLTKTTVSSLVDDLVSARLVTELGPEARGEIGRPGSALTLNRTGYVGIGLEINVDYIAVCVANLVGEVRYLRTRPRDNRGQSPAKVLGRAVRMTRTAIEAAEAARLTVAGLAVAVPGPVETERGLLRLAPNLGWVDVPVAEILADRFHAHDLAVVVDNEANLAALGELWFGGHQDLDDFIHVSGEIGVGGGIVIGGELFRGVRGFAGEIGHVVVQPDGRAAAAGPAAAWSRSPAGRRSCRGQHRRSEHGGPGRPVRRPRALAEQAAAGGAAGAGHRPRVVAGPAARLPPRPRRGRAGCGRGGRQAGPVR